MTPARIGGFGALIAVGVIVLVIALVASQSGPCAQASQALRIATTDPDPANRATALTLYSVKKAECEEAGSTVGD